MLPDWAKNMIRADLAREIGHADDPLAVTDDQIDGYFTCAVSAPSGRSTPCPCREPARLTSPSIRSADVRAVPLDWPHQVVMNIFAEGSFQFLDGGTLDVGVVGDSTLNGTNDYEIFVETFESLSFRGFESLQLVANVRPNGGSAGTISTSSY